MKNKLVRMGALVAVSFAAGVLFTGWITRTESVRAASGRVFELRVYHTLPGRLEALESNFRDHTIGIFNKHHLTSVGYWVPEDSPQKENTLIYILAHPSREAAKKNWDEFRADPEWQAVAKASEATGKTVEKIESTYMDPADFSQLK
jgi:hypothetical protein